MCDFKPTISKLTVIFMVDSLERCAQFYRAELGLELERTSDHLRATLGSGAELRFIEAKAVHGTSPMIEFAFAGGDSELN